MNETLNIYAQFDNHIEAYVVGTKEALLSLREAIDRALAEDSSSAHLCTGDGEGYPLIVIKVSEEQLREAMPPYAEMKCEAGVHPHEMLTKDRYLKLMRAK